MYSYKWDEETGGILLNTTPLLFSKEPRPVYYQELDILGFDKFWKYEKDDSYPYMWAEANNYFYFGRKVAKIKGGSLYTAPEIEIIEDPEPNGSRLKFVNIELMIKKNEVIMEALVKETIKKAYNTYEKYKNKVDIFHVSFSGGKDSIVALDIIQRALPHNEFKVVFGDTGMELPDTYKTVDIVEQQCKEKKIDFIRAKSDFSPIESWKLIGPPSVTIRWCCSVHKTAPQLLALRNLLGKPDFKEMAFVGVRADESLRRSGYDYVSMGTKHKGQYSCNPILEWSSAEVYLYIFMQNLYLNESYKKGNSRAGCIMCPMAGARNDFLLYSNYPKTAQPYIDLIKSLNESDKTNKAKLNSYLVNGGWNARKNGRDISISKKDYDEIKKGNLLTIKFVDSTNNWKQWIKTLGYLIENNNYNYSIKTDDYTYHFRVEKQNNYSFLSMDFSSQKYDAVFLKKFKQVFRKSHYCVSCRVCEANCRFGYISFENGNVKISDDCKKCKQCHEIDGGCVVYKSLWLPKGLGKMNNKSIDCYAGHAPKMDWFEQFVDLGEDFSTENRLGKNQLPNFKCFLKHSGILTNDNEETLLCKMLRKNGIYDNNIWALMFVNLAYTPQINWFIKHTKFMIPYTQKEFVDMIINFGASKSASTSVPNSFKRISALPISELGFGQIIDTSKNNGYTLARTPWLDPEPLVILYSLYKYAEACGDYYQFTLTRLLNHEIDSNGVSPTEIFGLDKDTMERILKGLSVNYPEFINASFSLDLDNITLRNDKNSQDVLTLFN